MVYTFTAEALNRVRNKITDEIKNQLDAKNLNATRRLRNSVSGTVFASSKSISLNIYAAEYFDSVDKGTKPGKRPPYNKIAEWAYAKGLQPMNKQNSKLRMIKSIQDAIATKGTIKRFGYKGAGILDYVDQKYKDEITEDIKQGYLKDLESQININGNS
jgi:hypothetical protein